MQREAIILEQFPLAVWKDAIVSFRNLVAKQKHTFGKVRYILAVWRDLIGKSRSFLAK